MRTLFATILVISTTVFFNITPIAAQPISTQKTHFVVEWYDYEDGLEKIELSTENKVYIASGKHIAFINYEKEETIINSKLKIGDDDIISLNVILYGIKLSIPKERYTYNGGVLIIDYFPPVIAKRSHLEKIRTDASSLAGNYIQVRDINLSSKNSTINWNPIGNWNSSSDAEKAFKGSYDGNGYTISGLQIRDGRDYSGLFGMNMGTLKNIRLTSGSVSGRTYVGALVGYNTGEITGCSSEIDVSGTGNYIGGICGYTNNFNTRDNYCTGNILGINYVGGITGYAFGLTNCTHTGNVEGSHYIGGICGYNQFGMLDKCCHEGLVTGQEKVSGVCGYVYDTGVRFCSNKGKVFGRMDVGGIVGYIYKGYITASGNEAFISGNIQIGGICGYSQQGNIYGCLNKGDIEGYMDKAGGITGYSWQGNLFGSCNRGNVKGNETVGGLTGYYFEGQLKGCYSSGLVDGKSGVGGVCGHISNITNVISCYWLEMKDIKPVPGIGNYSESNTAIRFGDGSQNSYWPDGDDFMNWGLLVIDSYSDKVEPIIPSTFGYFWKSLGGWNNGEPVFPKLYWE